MTVLIAGGGIAGLTLALSLHQIDVPVRVFETVSKMKPLGVGLNLLPHAVRELDELGFLPQLEQMAIATSELAYFTKRGQKIWSEVRGRDAGYNWPQFSIGRGALHMMLWDECCKRIGADNVFTRHHLSDWQDHDGKVTANFINHATGKKCGTYDGDILIGADGIHSAMRKSFEPDEGLPIWNGAILWRGVTRAKPYLSGKSMFMAGHQDQKFVCYPIKQHDDGTQTLNWIAELRFANDYNWRREDWNRAGQLNDFLPQFESWVFDWLNIPDLIRNNEQVYEFPMVDRDPLSRWTYGRATLLGDAAHAMYPIGSNGASQGILDARVLTREIQKHGLNEAALASYEAERRPATSKIVLANRGNGPEQVMQQVEDRAPDGFDILDDVISQSDLDEVAKNYKKLAGFDKDILNKRSSFVVRDEP